MKKTQNGPWVCNFCQPSGNKSHSKLSPSPFVASVIKLDPCCFRKPFSGYTLSFWSSLRISCIHSIWLLCQCHVKASQGMKQTLYSYPWSWSDRRQDRYPRRNIWKMFGNKCGAQKKTAVETDVRSHGDAMGDYSLSTVVLWGACFLERRYPRHRGKLITSVHLGRISVAPSSNASLA